MEENLLWHFVLGKQNKKVERLVGTVTRCNYSGLYRTSGRLTSGAEFDPASPAIPTFSGLILDALKAVPRASG